MHFLFFFNTSFLFLSFFLFSPPAGSCIPRSQGGGRGIAWMFMLCSMRIVWFVCVCVCLQISQATPSTATKGVRVCVWVRSCLLVYIGGCRADTGWATWRRCLKLGEGTWGLFTCIGKREKRGTGWGVEGSG